MTLFGLILAIGIVVDDAIVVLENVERIMASRASEPREAAIQAMREVSGPVVAIVLVLCAVFVPVVVPGRPRGRALPAVRGDDRGLGGDLRRRRPDPDAGALRAAAAARRMPAARGGRSGSSTAPSTRLTRGFTGGVGLVLRHALPALLVVLVMLGATWWLFERVPGGLVPQEDQGYVFLVTQLPPAASLDRTLAVTAQVTQGALENPAVENVVTLAGFDFLSGAQKTKSGVSFVSLKDWSERTDPREDARNLAPAFAALNARFRDGVVIGFNPPPIQGIGTTGGFELYLQDRSGGSLESLSEATQRVIAAANQRPELKGVSTTFSTGVPQYRVVVDREKAKALGVPIATVFDTMQSTFGSLYVNDFTLFGRTYRVTLSSEGEFRQSPDDLRHVFVRSRPAAPWCRSTCWSGHAGRRARTWWTGSTSSRPRSIQGNPAPGASSGQAIAAMQEVVAQTLSADYTIGWTGAGLSGGADRRHRQPGLPVRRWSWCS